MGRWVVGVSVKTDFITHSGSSELSLDSELRIQVGAECGKSKAKLGPA